jgi:uncharacterized protein (DUF4415 family)
MSKVSKRPSVVMPTLVEDRAINAAATADPDARPLTPKQLAAMVPLRSLRGRPKSANAKQLVSVRYSPEVLEYFKSTGEGWQSRMDGVLREYVTRRSRRAGYGMIKVKPTEAASGPRKLSGFDAASVVRRSRKQ